MTTIEIKQQIQQALNEMPESSLTNILNYINELKSQATPTEKLNQHLEKVLKEDREVLQRLAK